MKKFVCLLLILCLMVSLCGCGKENSVSTDQTAELSKEQSSEESLEESSESVSESESSSEESEEPKESMESSEETTSESSVEEPVEESSEETEEQSSEEEEIPAEEEEEISVEEEPARIYSLGEAIETDLFIIVPSFSGYAKELANWPDENYMMPEGKMSGQTPYHGGEETTMLYGEMQVEYIGKEKSDFTISIGLSADYDDGYIFDNPSISNTENPEDGWDYSGRMTFAPLSSHNTRIVRYCVQVADQVEQNPDKALFVTFWVNGEAYIYDFRSAEDGSIKGSDYDPRAVFYEPADPEVRQKVIDILKANGLEYYGYYDKTFGVYTFTFGDTDVNAYLPINASYRYDFTGTYEVYAGTILLSWDYGEDMHMDYTFDGENLTIDTFEHGR